MKILDTLIEDIYSTLENGLDVTDEQANAFGARMAEMLKTRLRKREDKPYLRMSMLGKNDSEIWHTLKGHKGEPLNKEARLKFLYGDVIEELVLTLAELAGHTVTDRQKECEIDGVKGHLDAKIDGELVDAKSCSSFGFLKFQQGDLKEDSFGYITQISGYAQSEKEEKGSFLAFDKTTGAMALMRVWKDKMVDVSVRVAHLRNILSKDTPPETSCSIKRSENGNEYLGSPCKYCPQKHNCHKNLRVFQYSDGPMYFTNVVKEPRVQEITKEVTNEKANN